MSKQSNPTKMLEQLQAQRAELAAEHAALLLELEHNPDMSKGTRAALAATQEKAAKAAGYVPVIAALDRQIAAAQAEVAAQQEADRLARLADLQRQHADTQAEIKNAIRGLLAGPFARAIELQAAIVAQRGQVSGDVPMQLYHQLTGLVAHWDMPPKDPLKSEAKNRIASVLRARENLRRWGDDPSTQRYRETAEATIEADSRWLKANGFEVPA